MPFSRARGKLGVDIFEFQVWCFIDFWPLFVTNFTKLPLTLLHVCQDNTSTLFVVSIKHWFKFDLSLTFDPLSVGRTKRSPFTRLHFCPHWPFYFCHLTHFVIWPFFDLWPFNRRSDEEITVDTYTYLTLLLLKHFSCKWPFWSLWPLHDVWGQTVDNFWLEVVKD